MSQYGRADVYFFLSVCGPCSRLKAKSQTLLPVRLQEMYDAVSNYQDVKGRDLALPFLKLPLKTVSTEKNLSSLTHVKSILLCTLLLNEYILFFMLGNQTVCLFPLETCLI